MQRLLLNKRCNFFERLRTFFINNILLTIIKKVRNIGYTLITIYEQYSGFLNIHIQFVKKKVF